MFENLTPYFYFDSKRILNWKANSIIKAQFPTASTEVVASNFGYRLACCVGLDFIQHDDWLRYLEIQENALLIKKWPSLLCIQLLKRDYPLIDYLSSLALWDYIVPISTEHSILATARPVLIAMKNCKPSDFAWQLSSFDDKLVYNL